MHYSAMQAAPKSEALRRNLGRSLLAHLVCKGMLFEALAWQHQAEAFIAADECGKQVACLQASPPLDCSRSLRASHLNCTHSCGQHLEIMHHLACPCATSNAQDLQAGG